MHRLSRGHKDLFEAITSGDYDNFALVAVEYNGLPTAAIVVVQDDEEKGRYLAPVAILIAGNDDEQVDTDLFRAATPPPEPDVNDVELHVPVPKFDLESLLVELDGDELVVSEDDVRPQDRDDSEPAAQGVVFSYPVGPPPLPIPR